MWFFIIWLLPIVVLFWLKWQQLSHGTIKDLLHKDVNPICKECGCCKDEFASYDWLVLVPFVGIIVIMWILFANKVTDFLNKTIK